MGLFLCVCVCAMVIHSISNIIYNDTFRKKNKKHYNMNMIHDMLNMICQSCLIYYYHLLSFLFIICVMICCTIQWPKGSFLGVSLVDHPATLAEVRSMLGCTSGKRTRGCWLVENNKNWPRNIAINETMVIATHW